MSNNITKVDVSIEVELEIHVPDHMLTPESLADFSSYMFAVETPADIYRYVAQQLAHRPYEHFIEGLGLATYMEGNKVSNSQITFRVVDTDTSATFTGGLVGEPNYA